MVVAMRLAKPPEKRTSQACRNHNVKLATVMKELQATVKRNRQKEKRRKRRRTKRSNRKIYAAERKQMDRAEIDFVIGWMEREAHCAYPNCAYDVNTEDAICCTAFQAMEHKKLDRNTPSVIEMNCCDILTDNDLALPNLVQVTSDDDSACNYGDGESAYDDESTYSNAAKANTLEDSTAMDIFEELPTLVMKGNDPMKWTLSFNRIKDNADDDLKSMYGKTHASPRNRRNNGHGMQKLGSHSTSWKEDAIPDDEYQKIPKKKRLVTRLAKYEEITEPTTEDIAALQQIPLLAVEITNSDYDDVQNVKSEGGLHWNRRHYIERVVLLEPDFTQVYITRFLNKFPHYQILREDVDAFMTYCRHPDMNVPCQYISRSQCHEEVAMEPKYSHQTKNDFEQKFILRVMNLSTEVKTAKDKERPKDEGPEWVQNGECRVRKAVAEIDFQGLVDLAMGEDKKVSVRGNFQKSIGGQMLNYDTGKVDGIPKPTVCPEASGPYRSTFVQASHVLEAMGYSFPDGDVDYERYRKFSKDGIDPHVRMDAMTAIATLYRWSDPETIAKDAKPGRTNANSAEAVASVSFDPTEKPSPSFTPNQLNANERSRRFSYMNVLKTHVDQGNAYDPGRDFSMGITKVGRLWEWKLDPTDDCWRYVCTGYIRPGATFYTKRAVTCSADKELWMKPLIEEFVGFFDSLPIWQQDLTKIFDALEQYKDGRIPLHTDMMSLISVIVSPFLKVHAKHQMCWEQAVEFGLIPVIANALGRLEELVLSWVDLPCLPSQHLAVYYANQARMKFGSAAGGEDARAQVSFTKPIPLSTWYLATKQVGEIISLCNDTLATMENRRCHDKLRTMYIKFCKDLQKAIPGAGELTSQRIAKFYVAIGLVDEPMFLTFAFIPITSKSGERVIDAIEKEVGDREVAVDLFKVHGIALLENLGRRIDRNEAVGENVVCKNKVDPNKREYLHKERTIMAVQVSKLVNGNGRMAQKMVFTMDDRTLREPNIAPFPRRKPLPRPQLPYVDQVQPPVLWECTDAAVLKTIEGNMESHILPIEFKELLQDDKFPQEDIKFLWASMTKDRRAIIMNEFRDDIFQYVETWPTFIPPRRVAARVDSTADLPSDDEACERTKATKAISRRRARLKKANRREHAEDDLTTCKERMANCMGRGQSGTNLPREDISSIVAIEGVYPSPWSAARFKPKRKKRQTEEQKAPADIERLLKSLDALESRCTSFASDPRKQAMFPSMAALETNGWDVTSSSMRKTSRKTEARVRDKVSGTPMTDHDQALAEETTNSSSSYKEGKYFFHPEFMVKRYFAGPSTDADLVVYKVEQPRHDKKIVWGYYATMVCEDREYDYSWATILSDMLPNVATFKDSGGRILYTTSFAAKIAASLNAALDTLATGTEPDVVAVKRRLEGNSRLFTELLQEKGRMYMFQRSYVRYLILKIGGAFENKRPVDKTVIVLVQKPDGRVFIGGYKDGVGAFATSQEDDMRCIEYEVPSTEPNATSRCRKREVYITSHNQRKVVRSHEGTVWKSLRQLHEHGKVWKFGVPTFPHGIEVWKRPRSCEKYLKPETEDERVSVNGNRVSRTGRLYLQKSYPPHL